MCTSRNFMGMLPSFYQLLLLRKRSALVITKICAQLLSSTLYWITAMVQLSNRCSVTAVFMSKRPLLQTLTTLMFKNAPCIDRGNYQCTVDYVRSERSSTYGLQVLERKYKQNVRQNLGKRSKHSDSGTVNCLLERHLQKTKWTICNIPFVKPNSASY